MQPINIEKIYKECGGLLEGHFLLSSGKHSPFYLQSAKVLENPKVAETLATALAKEIKSSNLEVHCVCSPAIGGILAGYELARALGVRFIFTERVNGEMTLRRGFSISQGERVLVCEDIITTGGSALECASQVRLKGGEVVGYAALANRGICASIHSNFSSHTECKLENKLPLFALGDFIFPTYEPSKCPLCKQGSVAIKPGSRGN